MKNLGCPSGKNTATHQTEMTADNRARSRRNQAQNDTPQEPTCIPPPVELERGLCGRGSARCGAASVTTQSRPYRCCTPKRRGEAVWKQELLQPQRQSYRCPARGQTAQQKNHPDQGPGSSPDGTRQETPAGEHGSPGCTDRWRKEQEGQVPGRPGRHTRGLERGTPRVSKRRDDGSDPGAGKDTTTHRLSFPAHPGVSS